MSKHKWYNEIVAWASGAEIEFYNGSILGWVDKNHEEWFEKYQYRIKPYPKEPQYLYVWIPHDEEGETIITHQKPRGVLSDSVYKYVGKIKLEVENE